MIIKKAQLSEQDPIIIYLFIIISIIISITLCLWTAINVP